MSKQGHSGGTMTAESQHVLAPHLARSVPSGVKGRPPSTLDVDWSILLDYNPPLGYRRSSRSTWDETSEKGSIKSFDSFEENDPSGDGKVCVILQNILRQLEKEIKDDRTRLKKERRAKRRERAQRRDDRFEADKTSEMADDNNTSQSRRQFRVVSASPGFSKSFADDRIRKRMLELKELQRANSFTLSSMRTCSLDRRSARDYRAKYPSWDWSRYSRDSGNFDVSMDTDDSSDVQNSDFSKDTDSDHTIENENSDTESVKKFIDDSDTDSVKAGADSVVKEESSVNNDSAMPTDAVHNDQSATGNISDTEFKKQFPHFDVLPSLKKNLADEYLNGNSTANSCAELKLRRSHTMDLAQDQKKENQIRSNEPMVLDGSEKPTTGGPYRLSIEIGANCVDPEPDKSKTSPIPKPPRRRPPSERKNLVRQKPVNNIETLLVSGEDYVNDASIDTTKENLKNTFCEFKSGNDIRNGGDITVNGATMDVGRVRAASPSGERTSVPAWRRELTSPSNLDGERPLSRGTSGYSTDDCSVKTSDSEDDAPDLWPRLDRELHRKLDRYFLVLKNGTTMALEVDNSRIPDQDRIIQSSVPLRKNVSMSDLAIPDHLGWLTDMSQQHKVWGVVVDMLFCIFEDQQTSKPMEAILLPGCSVRPLVYNSAINGINTHDPSKTISGISKFQIVIDNASTRKKYLFGLESQTELDSWFKVLRKASALDHDVTNDITTNGSRASPSPNRKRFSLDGEVCKIGYRPTHGSPNRVQKIARAGSPVLSPRDGAQSDLNGYSEGHPSPRGLVRHDSRRQSVKDFKKMLRREQTEPELSKTQPIKAQHFAQSSPDEKKKAPEKKLRSFGGSFESLLKFKRRKSKKDSECDSISNDDTGSIVSGSSLEQEVTSTSSSVDISAKSSKLKKSKSKQLSRSLDSGQPRNKNSNGIVRRASDIKDRVFPKRSSKSMIKLSDLKDPSMQGFLHHKYHLKWQKLWCVVCRGFFYGFKSQSAEDTSSLVAILANCTVAYVTEKDKRQKRIYVFKLSQENKRSIYLCCSDYKELLQWLTVLQMESNSVIANVQKLLQGADGETDSFNSSLSSQNGSIFSVPDSSASEEHGSRSRSKKKKKQAPPKPPRHSSCPPPVSRDLGGSEGGSISSGGSSETGTSGAVSSSQSEDVSSYASSDDIPRHDKALTHVWQSDRGYLFNVIRAKLSAYRGRQNGSGGSGGDIYNRELPGADNQGLLVVQDASKRKGSREIRKSRSFSTNLNTMSDTETPVQSPRSPTTSTSPSESPASLRKRHKPLVVKKIAAKDLEAKQSLAGYMERKGLSARWQRYWYILHEGTLFCYLTPDDTVTVDILNLHGYGVTSLVDKFRGKRFVLQLAHDNFTSLHLSADCREDMDGWLGVLEPALKKPSSSFKESEDDDDSSACAGCESNRRDDVGEKSRLVKQKLLEEMLRQKRELERKQAERHKRQRNKDPDSPESPMMPLVPEFLADEQRTSDVTRLRQRRLSTQLKVDTIQKQITKPTTNKRGLFGFGKSKKLDENKNEFLQDQLKELNTKLHKIDSDLNQVEQDKVLDNYDVNQNRKLPTTSVYSPEMTHEIEDDKGNGFKEKMQKWTTKTFNKTSLKRKQQNSRSPQNGSVPNLSMKQNGDVINGYACTDNESETDNVADDTVSLENSVTDLTRPTGDLRLDLNSSWRGTNGSGSPSSTRYSRSNSRTSSASNLSSPRKEIDPSVMAEIDAFEELTKQVLGARLKEQPAK